MLQYKRMFNSQGLFLDPKYADVLRFSALGINYIVNNLYIMFRMKHNNAATAKNNFFLNFYHLPLNKTF